ncbi:MAG: hypothetical protein Q4F01_02755 [Staphylococcus rostri]|uniref:hypothetical protein n=1 Tax=Staphylococcus rostri TaxID=522262 RepID=UPI0026DF0E05|nr:hypothetical protein [Staphylococcus rostri]MDO5375083.1 hypothetical protein [Staphylococcus rostri]
MNTKELIVMLTYNDFTVKNAYEVFDTCKDTAAQYWGFKDKGIPEADMKALFNYMKACGKTTFLEVVEYDEAESLQGAKLAKACDVDYLMGTSYFDSVNLYCQEHHIKYLPFAGDVINRPSILRGDVNDIVRQAKQLEQKGVTGFDLLGFRHESQPISVIQSFVSQIDLPVCVAGSIDSYDKLDIIAQANPWTFTIGSAFFDNKFGDDFAEQIDKVVAYMKQK